MRSKLLCLVLLCSTAIFSCKKQEQVTTEKQEQISGETLRKIKSMGFSTADVRKVTDGYVVEGDILLSEYDLRHPGNSAAFRIAGTEQYRTYNLLRPLPRVISVSITGLPATYTTALDLAISRYNTADLRLTFQRVASGGEIGIEYANLGPGVLGRSAGFPTAAGNPATPIKLNSNVIGSNPNQGYLATIIAHEIGHAIGMRHTDYFNRSYSCGATTPNDEGQAVVGAVNIPGTPTTEDPNSWMLACTDGGDRPFNANDLVALRHIYGGSGGSGSVISVAPQADGTIIGVGLDNSLWTRASLYSPWIHVPASGVVLGITVMPNGTIVGIGSNNDLWTRADINSGWVNIPNSGAVIAITAMPNGTLLGVGTDNQLYTRATLTSNWVNVPNSGVVKGVAVFSNGSILGIDLNNELWTRGTLTSSWVHVPNSGAVIAIAILPNSDILGVGTDNELYTRASINSNWVHVQ